MNKIEKLKNFLNDNYCDTQAFNTRNLVGDEMTNVYDEDGIQVDYCYYYDYIEIFGLTDNEFRDLIEDVRIDSDLKTFKKEEIGGK